MRRPEFRWGSEPPPERPWGAWLLAVALHVPLIFGWITGRPVDDVRRPNRLIELAPLELEGREVRIPIPAPVPEASRGVREPRATLFSPPPPAPPVPLAERPTPATSTPIPPSGHGRVGRLGPGLGEGKLWVEPLPLAPRQLASVLTRRSQREITDSFVTAVIQAYLDSIAHDPDVAPLQPPSWVATVGGQKFGIDASHIYIAGLKIPTAVLAFLPLPGGNQRPIDHRLEAMAYDLRVAGARSANLQEFREAVQELRRKNEADREFERNRGTAPGDTLTGSVEH